MDKRDYFTFSSKLEWAIINQMHSMKPMESLPFFLGLQDNTLCLHPTSASHPSFSMLDLSLVQGDLKKKHEYLGL